MINAISFIVSVVIIMISAYALGAGNEMEKIKQKCLVEMEDKPLKEATKICTERVR